MDFSFDPSLALYLPLYEPDGASFMSKDAYGHLGIVTGATWGIQGRTFDGTDDRITAPVIDVSTGTGLTVLIWFKRLGASGGSGSNAYHDLLGAINGDPDNRVMITSDGTGLRVELSGVIQTMTISNATIFNQVGVMWNGTNLYPVLNGVLGTASAVASLTSGVTGTLVGWHSSEYFISNGIIGEILIYNRAFNQVELTNAFLGTKWRYR